MVTYAKSTAKTGFHRLTSRCQATILSLSTRVLNGSIQSSSSSVTKLHLGLGCPHKSTALRCQGRWLAVLLTVQPLGTGRCGCLEALASRDCLRCSPLLRLSRPNGQPTVRAERRTLQESRPPLTASADEDSHSLWTDRRSPSQSAAREYESNQTKKIGQLAQHPFKKRVATN